MKRHYVLLYFFLLALLAMTGMFLGCSASRALAASDGVSVGQGGDAIYVASNNYVVPATTYTRPNNANNPKDGMWLQYVGRSPAFANCSPCVESPSYKATGKKSSKKAKKVRRTASKKKTGKSAKKARRSTTSPAVQNDLFPEAICPPGCVPEKGASRGAPRISSLSEATKTPARPAASPVRPSAAASPSAAESQKIAAPPTISPQQDPASQVKAGAAASGQQNGAYSASGTVSANDNFKLRAVSTEPKPVETVVPSVPMVPAALTSGSSEVAPDAKP